MRTTTDNLVYCPFLKSRMPTIETSFAEVVDSGNAVGLWANCADDGSTAVILGWLEFSWLMS